MFRKRLIYNVLFKLITVSQILSRTSEGVFVNNYTIIKIVNEMKTTWTAGVNHMDIPDTFNTIETKNSTLPVLQAKSVRTPVTFDARLHWKNCSSIIGRIRSQGKCGSCWAVAAAGMMSDRTCIETNGRIRVHLSVEDITTCCPYCSTHMTNFSCSGGHKEDAVYFWMKEGIVTGGEVNSTEGCKPYSQRSYTKKHSPCTKHCSNRKHWKEYEEDKHKGRIVYRVRRDEESIRNEIFKHGPVVTSIFSYTDFHQYTKGVFKHEVGTLRGRHAIKILGWGEEDGEKYWLCANTWGTTWGLLKGFFKILRGKNEVTVEDHVVAGRMSDTLAPGEILRAATASHAEKGKSVHGKSIFFQSFYFWILVKETLQNYCSSVWRL